MIRKAKEQFDSGGIRLVHNPFLPFDTANKFIDSDKNIIKLELDKYLEEAAESLKFELECFIMWSSGYEGIEEGVWVKKIDEK